MPIPGLKRVVADGSVLYTTDDGRYLFYGVLLAFVVVGVWEDLHRTEGAVRDEAKATVDLHHLTSALPEPGADRHYRQ